MGSHLWFFYALTTSMLWGLGYVFSEKILKAGIAPPFLMLVYLVVSVPIFLLLTHFTNNLKPGIEILASNKIISLYFAIVIACFIVANYLIFTSISLKNATLASLVEISYPYFTVLFTWAIFKEFQLTVATAFGALLIFSGITLIYLKS
ncbi:MAG: hypothetical protein DHS20C02_05520 [Micavibrio sp.]|nr:MAG: hypothetical protein DHS20C02_05520 [Micavibrio sp.]